MAKRNTLNPSDTPPPTLLQPFAEFFRLEASGGIILLLAASAALVLANSPLGPGYLRFWNTPFTVGGGDWVLSKPLILWVNDGLMAVFFFVVGLEIKREVLVGELSSFKKAAVPISAAIGGMLVPALLYLALNHQGSAARGWGIPMATDIAFALGILALLGKRAPLGLKVFLTAVAIIDDIGAVLVIALFYTSKVGLAALGIAGAVVVVLAILNRAGTRSPLPYVLLGIILWLAVLKSGIHATVAGVILAFFIPSQRAIDEETFLEKARSMLDLFASAGKTPGPMPSSTQRNAIQSLEILSRAAEAPLARLEEGLHPWVAFLIIPVFAFANAGVTVEAGMNGLLRDSVMLGVALGLFVGKPIGVLAFTWIAARSGIGELPEGVRWIHIAGAAALCGVGFTMSLFIGGLAFELPQNLAHAKVGIVLGSALSATLGALLIRAGSPRRPAE